LVDDDLEVDLRATVCGRASSSSLVAAEAPLVSSKDLLELFVVEEAWVPTLS
jgi:hypothetical protein